MKKKSLSNEERIQRIKRNFAILMMLSGILVFAYPFISNAIATRNASVVIQDYDQSIEDMDEEEKDSLKKTMTEYNQMLSSVEDSDSAETMESGEMLGYITIPTLELRLAIYEGTTDEVLSKGVGHITNSSYPVGGESTHCLLSGHRGMSNAELFTYLPDLKKGDKFYLHVLGDVLAYQVDQIKTVEPEDTSDLQVVENEDYCTLITCTPLGINSHRLLVRGTRIPYTGEDEDSQIYMGLQTGNIVRRITELWPWLLLYTCIVVGVEAFVMILLIRRVRKEAEED